MSLRIQNDSLAGTGALGTGRADEISHASDSSSSGIGGTGHRGGDSVDISSLSQSVAAASTAHASQQAARVSRLAALYQSGHYNVESNLVSRAIVDQALSADPGEGA
ncbi:MAG TPA: flagellar biosynthesis anti-sigma factor FlgM [Bryobacteraceae bacterium]|nr:flagellar biosynthesis anti-sigma factor FlgM [Bryobacteraceae bacterium]